MISGKTKIYGIIGNPVSHSLSPVMHNTAFQKLGLDCAYVAFHVEDVKSAIAGVRGLNIQGLSVTIPHKTSVMDYLDWIDDTATKIGAVNTVVNDNGLLKGYNTDGLGAYRSIANRINLNGLQVVIIGNGGTAKAIAYTILKESNLDHLYILGRNKYNVDQFTNQLKQSLNIENISSILNHEDSILKSIFNEAKIIINTSPVGMSPDDKRIPIAPDLINKDQVVFDVVYKPLKTRLLQEAEERGAIIINGLEMLVNQGAAQFAIWTNEKAPYDVMYSIIKDKVTS